MAIPPVSLPGESRGQRSLVCYPSSWGHTESDMTERLSTRARNSAYFAWLLLLLQIASVVSNSMRPHRRQPTRLPRPWDSPGKNTGVGCHCLLQCMKVKSESEVAQSCPTLHDPVDCSPPGSSIHGIFQARVLEWGAIAFSKLLPRRLLKL